MKKKQTKWLDNFGKADNANESNVSLPDNFNGLAYDTSYRDYSPAWGGQFQDGGYVPIAQTGITQQDVTRVDNNAADRIWGIQRELDAEKLSRDAFKEKYGMPLHQFKMRDSNYASAFQRQLEQRRQQDPNYAEVNLPSTDIRSSVYQGNPNLAFLPGTSEGQSRAALEDAFLATTTLSAPLLPVNTAKIGQLSKIVGNYLTTQTPLRNTYNLLPEGTFKGYSKLKNPSKSYRVAGMDAFDDFVESGVLRSKRPELENNQNLSLFERMQLRPTTFPSFQKGYADLAYLPEQGGVVFETSLPTFKRGQINPVTGVTIGGRHYAHRVIDPETGATLTNVPGKNISVYTGQPNWLKGHKQIDIPKKEQGGSIPGTVGFTYARTGSTPSEGKYAKKTLPSALNGKEMKFYQEGLDWKPKSMRDGGITKDNQGYWNPDNWGKMVEIDSNEITMMPNPYTGVEVPYDVLAFSDEGDVQYMEPGKDYKFKGSKVTEVPVAQDGIQAPYKLPEYQRQFQNYDASKSKPSKNYSVEKVDWYESINPKNWGLIDRSKYPNFNSAFRSARDSGESEFVYKGDRYNTRLIDEKESDLYHESKAFLKDYYINEPFKHELDTFSLSQQFNKEKYGMTRSEFYNSTKEEQDSLDYNNPRYQEINNIYDKLSEVESWRFNKNLPQEFLDYLTKNKASEEMKRLDEPYYFSITSQKPEDMSEDGYLDPKSKKIFMYADPNESRLNTTYIHELSHKGDTPDVYDRVPKINIDLLNEMGTNLNQSGFNYLSDPSEIEARKMSTLFYLKKNGIPYKTGEITESALEELKNKKRNDELPYDISQLLELYKWQSDDLLKYLNNDFSYLEKKKNGGSVGINQLDAQPMKKLNQLLNFTNNPDKTNWLDKYQ